MSNARRDRERRHEGECIAYRVGVGGRGFGKGVHPPGVLPIPPCHGTNKDGWRVAPAPGRGRSASIRGVASKKVVTLTAALSQTRTEPAIGARHQRDRSLDTLGVPPPFTRKRGSEKAMMSRWRRWYCSVSSLSCETSRFATSGRGRPHFKEQPYSLAPTTLSGLPSS